MTQFLQVLKPLISSSERARGFMMTQFLQVLKLKGGKKQNFAKFYDDSIPPGTKTKG